MPEAYIAKGEEYNMGITVKHGKPSTIISAAKRAGKAKAAQRASEQAMAAAARLREKQMDMEYRTALAQQDRAIDLQMNERAKLWEIQKMELRSQTDFAREEQARQRKLDSYDNALQQIDKEVLAGRMTEQEAYPLKLKYEMNKMGVDAPTSLLPTGDEEDKYGVRPYYLEPEFERDYPELAEAKKKEVISGQRRGTVPYYLDPEYIRTNPAAARQAQEARGIFLSDEEFDDLTGTPTELPLGDKQLDVGVQVEEEKTLNETQARLILERAGGDKERARQIARQMGYSF